MHSDSRLRLLLAPLATVLLAAGIVACGGDDESGGGTVEFTPVDIALRYEVLDKGDADLSILFTTDAQLFTDSETYTILEDDQEVFPPGNVIMVADQQVVEEAGPDFQEVVEQVQEPLTLEVVQELNARVDVDKEDPADVAADYLREIDPVEENPDNNGVELVIGSKNFTEQILLGEIYAQALEAAGYDVTTDLNLGSEVIALKALEQGEISAYPEYTSTALTSFFDVEAQDVPADPTEGYEQAKAEFEQQGLTAFPPTPFESANAVGLLTETADDLGVETVSDLQGVSEDLTLAGSPECRQRVDCLVGLEEDYGLNVQR